MIMACSLAFPRIIAPASISTWTQAAVFVFSGYSSSHALLHRLVLCPAISMLSLTVIRAPSNGRSLDGL